MSGHAYIHIVAVAAIAALVTACGNPAHDARLSHIDALADSTLADGPRRALAALDSIDPAALGDADRHYYDFLTVKARDKAYITHTSDSLILDVIGYYSAHRGDVPPYAEVLYYGGRVYSDLGDFPTALTYFRQAVDAILLGRSNGAIVSRREMLCVKIFDKKMGTKVIDAIIRSI